MESVNSAEIIAQEPTTPRSDESAATSSSEAEKEPESNPNMAAHAFSNQIFTLIGHEDVADITFLQADILEKMRTSNISLKEFNDIAASKYEKLSADFQGHTAMIKEMKKDLDWIFKKIRMLKQKLGDRYPDVMAEVAMPFGDDEEEY